MLWTYDRIMVATDGSVPGLAALGWAARVAEDLTSELVVIHAYDVDSETVDPEQAAAAKLRLDRWCAEHGALGIDQRTEAYPGDPRSVLLDALGREQPDLLVAGTRGGGGFPGLVLGSVAEWLTQVITFPLAVVPHDGHDRTGGPILVGIDGSPQSGLALDWAIGLADRLRRRVHALYAVAPRGAAQEAAAAGREPGIDAVHREIARARSEARAAHVVLYLTECAEHPVTALATRADDENAEAIVVGARGFGQFGELTIGRVPRQLLHVAHRPVVIIPS